MAALERPTARSRPAVAPRGPPALAATVRVGAWPGKEGQRDREAEEAPAEAAQAEAERVEAAQAGAQAEAERVGLRPAGVLVRVGAAVPPHALLASPIAPIAPTTMGMLSPMPQIPTASGR